MSPKNRENISSYISFQYYQLSNEILNPTEIQDLWDQQNYVLKNVYLVCKTHNTRCLSIQISVPGRRSRCPGSRGCTGPAEGSSTTPSRCLAPQPRHCRPTWWCRVWWCWWWTWWQAGLRTAWPWPYSLFSCSSSLSLTYCISSLDCHSLF